MKQLTIRGFDDELEKRLRKLAREEHLSLNKAVLKLLNQAAGLNGTARTSAIPVVGGALDEFVGVWSEEEERRFNQTVEAFEVVDGSLWS
jgi:hypothetical protein